MKNEAVSTIKRRPKPDVIMFIDTTGDISRETPLSFSDKQTFAMADAKKIYEYLRFRRCKVAYSNLTDIPGVIQVSFAAPNGKTGVIIDELNEMGRSNRWKIYNRLEDYTRENRNADNKSSNAGR